MTDSTRQADDHQQARPASRTLHPSRALVLVLGIALALAAVVAASVRLRQGTLTVRYVG